jgi:catechol 2,3-dioxygenase-like lactoylglutathione lyase family enzyme
MGSAAGLVQDAEKSAEWKREILGLEIVGDLGPTILGKPPGASLSWIHRCGPNDSSRADRPGGRTGIGLHCGARRIRRNRRTGRVLPASDPHEVEKTYSELKAQGIVFSEELTTAEWGQYAILQDPDGNEFGMSWRRPAPATEC